LKSAFPDLLDASKEEHDFLQTGKLPGEHLEMALEEPANIINHARNSNSTPLVARLTKCPRSLHALWKEWEVGGTGQKPVRLWTGTKRGKHKATLYKRKFLGLQ
jgi:hypothetical protein